MTIVFPPYKISRPPLIVCELAVYVYEPKSDRYPVEIETIIVGKYSSLEKAEEKMRELIDDEPDNLEKDSPQIHSFSIQEIGIDVPDDSSLYDERIYDDHGRLYGIEENMREPFTGKESEDCRFKTGDFVEFIMGKRLNIAIVAGLPLSPKQVDNANVRYSELYNEGHRLKDLNGKPYAVLHCDQSDNTYTVAYAGNSLLPEHDLGEFHLFTPRFPIKARTRRRLHEYYRYESGVFIRYDTEKEEYRYGLELNNFMLHRFKEPHVVIFDYYLHILISLDSYEILKGNPEKFDSREIEALMGLIKKNEEKLKGDFRKMMDEYKRSQLLSGVK